MWFYPWGGMPHARTPTCFCVQGLGGSLAFAFAFEPLSSAVSGFSRKTPHVSQCCGVSASPPSSGYVPFGRLSLP